MTKICDATTINGTCQSARSFQAYQLRKKPMDSDSPPDYKALFLREATLRRRIEEEREQERRVLEQERRRREQAEDAQRQAEEGQRQQRARNQRLPLRSSFNPATAFSLSR
ncbi:hypothetical protein KXW42_006026 [Aspergillus fumigatus]|nr:hypothetical protein KXW42_006026 [Aspergillus fumigatus]